MTELFSSLQIGPLRLKNRILMPPMVLFGLSDESGLATPLHVEHYRKRAAGGVGMIVLEATCVQPDGRLSADQLGAWDDSQIAGLSEIAQAIHENDVPCLVQIHHAGILSPAAITESPAAPSKRLLKDGRTAHEMPLDELHAVQQAFVAAALRVQQAGFDGVELHGAHGYLIGQFLSNRYNHRLDAYGGSPENRTRFAVEIAQSIRAACGPDFVIGCRLGVAEPTVEDGIVHARLLEKAGVQMLNLSFGCQDSDLPDAPEGSAFHPVQLAAARIKAQVSIPTAAVYGLTMPTDAAAIIDHRIADMAALGHALLADPAWPQKARNAGLIRFCRGCKTCLWHADPGRNRCPANK